MTVYAREETAHLRHGLITQADAVAQRLVTITDPPAKQMAGAVRALEKIVETYLEVVDLVSTSNPGYAMRDLPIEEQRALERTRHNIKILNLLYQAA